MYEKESPGGKVKLLVFGIVSKHGFASEVTVTTTHVELLCVAG